MTVNAGRIGEDHENAGDSLSDTRTGDGLLRADAGPPRGFTFYSPAHLPAFPVAHLSGPSFILFPGADCAAGWRAAEKRSVAVLKDIKDAWRSIWEERGAPGELSGEFRDVPGNRRGIPAPLLHGLDGATGRN